MEEMTLFEKQYEYYIEMSRFVSKQMDKEEFKQAIIEGRTYIFPTVKEGILKFYVAGDLPEDYVSI